MRNTCKSKTVTYVRRAFCSFHNNLPNVHKQNVNTMYLHRNCPLKKYKLTVVCPAALCMTVSGERAAI